MTDTLTRQLAGALAELRAATVRIEDDPDLDAAKGPADMALALWATRYQPGEPRDGGATSIVPAFFVVQAEPEFADEAAAAAAMFLNDAGDGAEHPAGAPLRLFLCEASPTTEWDEGAEIPHTLEGLTCDSGSDRSAAGLIRAISDHARAVEGSTPAELTASVVAAFGRIQQLAEGWLRQRMALHPVAPPVQPAEAIEEQGPTALRLATAERVARALSSLLERGEFGDAGGDYGEKSCDFFLIASREDIAEHEAAEEADPETDHMPIAEVREGYDALQAWRELIPAQLELVQANLGAPVRKVCGTCGSENVHCDAGTRWDYGKQAWVVVDEGTGDGDYCFTCDANCEIVDAPHTSTAACEPPAGDQP